MMNFNIEIGCWADGSLGHEHTRLTCAALIADYAAALNLVPSRAESTAALIADLRGPMSDDASEELDACDWLNDLAAVDGAYWGWHDGDFGLWATDGEE